MANGLQTSIDLVREGVANNAQGIVDAANARNTLKNTMTASLAATAKGLQTSIGGLEALVTKNAKGIAALVTAMNPQGKKCANPSGSGHIVQAGGADLNDL